MSESIKKINNIKYDRILSCLYGQAYADAFAMPSELWTRPKVQSFFGIIDTFIPGPKENIAANEFTAGQYTDDTSQALALADSFIELDGKVDSKNVAKHIMNWANKIDAFEKNILGPSSKNALTLINQNVPVEELENLGVTNGACMRISPVGLVTSINDLDFFEKQVYNACACTHKSDVAIAGAGAIAYMISSQIDGNSWSDSLKKAISYSKELQDKYHNTFSPFIYACIDKAIDLSEKYISYQNSNTTTNIDTTNKNYLNDNDIKFSQAVYEYIGTDMQTYTSVPAAFAIANYCISQNAPLKIAHICANLGGDTDTIGAMGLAMASAGYATDIFPSDHLDLLSKANNTDFHYYATQISKLRK